MIRLSSIMIFTNAIQQLCANQFPRELAVFITFLFIITTLLNYLWSVMSMRHLALVNASNRSKNDFSVKKKCSQLRKKHILYLPSLFSQNFT